VNQVGSIESQHRSNAAMISDGPASSPTVGRLTSADVDP
jgi:hypothetical protein